MFIQKCRLDKGLKRKNLQTLFKEQKNALHKYNKASFIRVNTLKLKHSLALFGNRLSYILCIIVAALTLCYRWFRELQRFCPKPHFGPQTGSEFYIIGHRGAAAHEIENTIPAFTKALNTYGANALEIDLCFTRDEQAVIWHDWDPDSFLAIARQAGLEPDVKYRPYIPQRGPYRKPVPLLTLNELKTNYGYAFKNKYPRKLAGEIPSLEQFMAWAAHEQKLKLVILDFKVPVDDIGLVTNMLEHIDKLLIQYKPHYLLLLMTPEEKIMKRMIKIKPELEYTKDVVFPPGIVLHPEGFSAVQTAIELKINFASAGRPTLFELAPWTTFRRLVQHDLQLKADFNTPTRESNRQIKGFLGWTINKRREMKCLVKTGIDGLVTDHPQKLAKVARKLRAGSEYADPAPG